MPQRRTLTNILKKYKFNQIRRLLMDWNTLRCVRFLIADWYITLKLIRLGPHRLAIEQYTPHILESQFQIMRSWTVFGVKCKTVSKNRIKMLPEWNTISAPHRLNESLAVICIESWRSPFQPIPSTSGCFPLTIITKCSGVVHGSNSIENTSQRPNIWFLRRLTLLNEFGSAICIGSTFTMGKNNRVIIDPHGKSEIRNEPTSLWGMSLMTFTGDFDRHN